MLGIMIRGEILKNTTMNPNNKIGEQGCDSGQFSRYGKGCRNREGKAVLQTKPKGEMNIAQTYELTKGEMFKATTEAMRQLVAQRQNPDKPTNEEKKREQEFKKLNFEIVTVGGIFNYRHDSGIQVKSGLRAVDIDDLPSTAEARRIMEIIIKDKFLKSALCYLSPRGRGVKNIVEIPEEWREFNSRKVFELITMHYQFHYGIFIDQSGSDISRAAYLCYDPDCYINPKYISSPQSANQ